MEKLRESRYSGTNPLALIMINIYEPYGSNTAEITTYTGQIV